MIRLVQLKGPAGRRLGVVERATLHLVDSCASVYELARVCIEQGRDAAGVLAGACGDTPLNYDEVYTGASEWQLLPCADHPGEPARCLVSGTGLTHMASARNRQAMHGDPEDLTDSMRMYRSGVEGGKPASGEIGVAPEWFYKGNGTCLRAHNQALTIPDFGEDGGEEPEVAGVYVIDSQGAPWRIGLTQGNEFSDHEFERRNYLYLAASKLRACSHRSRIDHRSGIRLRGRHRQRGTRGTAAVAPCSCYGRRDHVSYHREPGAPSLQVR